MWTDKKFMLTKKNLWQRVVKKPIVSTNVPHVLDAALAIFTEKARFGTHLYGEDPVPVNPKFPHAAKPMTFTNCQEKFDAGFQLLVGGFVPGGLSVSSGHFNDYGKVNRCWPNESCRPLLFFYSTLT